jgi:hypothetical protein
MLKTYALFFLAFAGTEVLIPSSSQAQAAYTATRNMSIQIGGGLSLAGSDFTYSYIKGASIYGSIDFGRHFGIEADIHDTAFFTPDDIGEKSYLLGVRYGFNKNRFHPYAKVQAGLGTFEYQPHTYTAANATYGIFAFGGGVDFHLNNKFNLRLVDLESQHWPGFAPHGLTPVMATTGFAYRF